MTPKMIKRAGSWILLTTMLAMFAAASWYLGLGVLSARIENLMTGGCLMFIAVTLAWLRLSLSDRVDRALAQHGPRWTSLMGAEPA